jgi:hypothetical protein
VSHAEVIVSDASLIPEVDVPGARIHIQREGGVLPPGHRVLVRVIGYRHRPFVYRGVSGLRNDPDGWPRDLLLVAPK